MLTCEAAIQQCQPFNSFDRVGFSLMVCAIYDPFDISVLSLFLVLSYYQCLLSAIQQLLLLLVLYAIHIFEWNFAFSAHVPARVCVYVCICVCSLI